mmetsp:Transcript_25099/g.69957  ORF Transcript_25099/g.69957 Transcript_25099/m.69957 type:complete len:352 (+) Transcript_25099:444-1499(+)
MRRGRWAPRVQSHCGTPIGLLRDGPAPDLSPWVGSERLRRDLSRLLGVGAYEVAQLGKAEHRCEPDHRPLTFHVQDVHGLPVVDAVCPHEALRVEVEAHVGEAVGLVQLSPPNHAEAVAAFVGGLRLVRIRHLRPHISARASRVRGLLGAIRYEVPPLDVPLELLAARRRVLDVDEKLPLTQDLHELAVGDVDGRAGRVAHPQRRSRVSLVLSNNSPPRLLRRRRRAAFRFLCVAPGSCHDLLEKSVTFGPAEEGNELVDVDAPVMVAVDAGHEAVKADVGPYARLELVEQAPELSAIEGAVAVRVCLVEQLPDVHSVCVVACSTLDGQTHRHMPTMRHRGRAARPGPKRP